MDSWRSDTQSRRPYARALWTTGVAVEIREHGRHTTLGGIIEKQPAGFGEEVHIQTLVCRT
jgi:hypothetical protein